MYPQYTVYPGDTADTNVRQHPVSAAWPQHNRYRARINLDCIVTVIHLILWKKLSKIPVCFRLDCIRGAIRFVLGTSCGKLC